MGFKEVTSNATDIKGFKDEPFEGVYMGSKEIDTKLGSQIIYKFQKTDGGMFSVYGFTNLNRFMEMVSEGSLVRLTYRGKENVKTKFGMKDVHQVTVEVDEDYTHEHTEEEAF